MEQRIKDEIFTVIRSLQFCMLTEEQREGFLFSQLDRLELAKTEGNYEQLMKVAAGNYSHVDELTKAEMAMLIQFMQLKGFSEQYSL